MTGPHERYTHGHAASVLRAHSNRTVDNSLAYGRAWLQPGTEVLDLGCGPGTISVDIAARVAPARVVAVDLDPGVLEQARAAAREQGVTNLEFRRGNAYALDLPDASVDLAHAHQVLQHLADPVAALRELARVTRPGGRIAVRDADYSAFTWYPANPGLDHWLDLYRSVARHNGGEPDAGRRLLAWAHAAGLRDLTVSSSTWTYPAGPEATWWGGVWADRILHSAIAEQAVGLGLATPADLAAISEAWRRWASDPDAWFMVPHGEVVARVSAV